jgi:hypothetical protein
MTPPNVPGIPGTRLPEPWEAEVAELKRRVAQLEQDAGLTRAQLQSYSDEEEDSKVTIPSDAPRQAKVALGALAGLTPTGRAVVLVVLGLAAIAAATLLILRGVKLF